MGSAAAVPSQSTLNFSSVWVETSLVFISSRVVRGIVAELLSARALPWLPSPLHIQNGRPNEGDYPGSKRLVSHTCTTCMLGRGDDPCKLDLTS